MSNLPWPFTSQWQIEEFARICKATCEGKHEDIPEDYRKKTKGKTIGEVRHLIADGKILVPPE